MTSSPTSQNLDHVVEVATVYIEQHLDQAGLVQWAEVKDHLIGRGHSAQATVALTRAVLDLERTGALFYALEGLRRPHPGDAEPAPLEDVAAAVLSLPWPCLRGNRKAGGRSIWEAYEELGSRYRHCDVYEAMHTRLKGHELRGGQKYWHRTERPSRFDAAGRFARRAEVVAALPPTSPPRRQLEADLVTAYLAALPHRGLREYPIGDLRADVYEPAVRRLVEAKAAADVVTVAHAWAQAVAYRYLANRSATGDRAVVESIAVLLPVRPTGDPRSLLDHLAADSFHVELIYPDGDGFCRELLT